MKFCDSSKEIVLEDEGCLRKAYRISSAILVVAGKELFCFFFHYKGGEFSDNKVELSK